MGMIACVAYTTGKVGPQGLSPGDKATIMQVIWLFILKSSHRPPLERPPISYENKQ